MQKVSFFQKFKKNIRKSSSKFEAIKLPTPISLKEIILISDKFRIKKKQKCQNLWRTKFFWVKILNDFDLVSFLNRE